MVLATDDKRLPLMIRYQVAADRAFLNSSLRSASYDRKLQEIGFASENARKQPELKIVDLRHPNENNPLHTEAQPEKQAA